MTGKHDTREALDIIAIYRGVNGFDTIAGRAKDGREYVRMYDVSRVRAGVGPELVSTDRHGSAFGLVMSLGGFVADGVA